MSNKIKSVILTILVIVVIIIAIIFIPFYLGKCVYFLFHPKQEHEAFIYWLAGMMSAFFSVLVFSIIGALIDPICELYETIEKMLNKRNKFN